MDLKLTNLDAVAVMNALHHYLIAVEKTYDCKSILTEKMSGEGFVSRIEPMPAGDVQ